MKEFHVYLDNCEQIILKSYKETKLALENKLPIIRTYQTNFICSDVISKGYRLFIHSKIDAFEITIGNCDRTDKYIREEHNLEKLVLSGLFNFNI